MKNNNFSRFTKLAVAALVLLCGVAFTGCKPDVQYRDVYYYVLPMEADSPLIGTWAANEYEQYIITDKTFESVDTYKGNSLVVLQETKDSGRIFVKYSNIPDWTKGQADEPADKTGWTYLYGSWYPSNSELTGKWYAISYKDLKDDSIKISGAFKTGGVKATATLEKAIEEFTIENGYFSQYSTCTKQ